MNREEQVAETVKFALLTSVNGFISRNNVHLLNHLCLEKVSIEYSEGYR